MRTCYIVGAGEWTARDFAPVPGDLVIAADGGLRALQTSGVRPDLLVGDLDSLGDCPLPADLPLLRFPVRKDDTDTGLALAEGLRRGYRAFALYGCAGGRADHLLANFQSMAAVSRRGASVRLAAPAYDAYAVTDAALALPPRPEGTLVSVFCLGALAEGVTLTGLSYPLRDASLSPFVPLGVSNRRTADPRAAVSVRRGTLLVLQHLMP